MKKIAIAKPCTEDWGQMTPTEKGAFCSRCSHDVIDFTKSSSQEIRDILWERRNHQTCGRFEKSQLDLINKGLHPWQNDTSQAFQSKFLYACLLAFGLSLFTACETDPGSQVQTEQQIEQEIEGHNNALSVPDSSACVQPDGAVNTGEYTFSTDLKGRVTSYW